MRAPHLHDTLRRFCLGAFAVFTGISRTASTSRSRSRSTAHTAGRRSTSTGRSCAASSRRGPSGSSRGSTSRMRSSDLLREPAARIFAHAHEGEIRDERRAVYRSVLVPLLVRTAEGCGGFDWDDSAFARAYDELEGSLYGEGHSYGAVAPLIGLSVGTQIELGDGIRVRVAATGELGAMWPEAAGLLPRNFGREPDRICVIELERSLTSGTNEAPDAPGELADAITAIRLATAAPVAAGPVLFERLDWRPYGIRPVLPIAATAPRASRRGSICSAPRWRRHARPPRGGRRRRAARRRPRPLGARALPVGAVPRRAAPPGARGRARGRRRSLGGRDARCRSARRDSGGARRPRGEAARAEAPSCCGGSSSPSSCTATGRRSSATSTRRCSAPRGRSRASSSARANRHRHVTSCRLPSGHGGGARGSGPAGADQALEREGAGVPSLLAELRELVREAAEWAEQERDPRSLEAAAALGVAGEPRRRRREPLMRPGGGACLVG